MKMKIFVRILLTSLFLAIGAYILAGYEYLSAFDQIDNVVGMLPIVLVLTVLSGLSLIIWTKQILRRLPLLIFTVAIVVLSAALFPNALHGNWWIEPKNVETAENELNLAPYAPFSKNSLLATLSEEADLHLTEDLPIIDGATALYPLYAAFAEAVYAEEAYFSALVNCQGTRSAYEALINGDCDIIFVATASQKQSELAEAADVELYFTPIGKEAFVFLTAKDNPIESLNYQQLRNIYSGKTAYWQTLGWKEGRKIIAYQRPDGSGSQTGLQMIMGDLPIQVPQPLPDESLIGSDHLMKQLSVTWQGVQPALGYSYRFYATSIFTNPDTKLLKINNIEPKIENIQDGTYPFVADFYAVTNGKPQGNTKILIDWILSSQGQEIVIKTGYISLK